MSTTKEYTIFCITKANNTQYLHKLLVTASSVSEAKAAASDRIWETIGRHAFRLSNGKPDKDLREWFEKYGTTPTDVIYSLAARPQGIDIFSID